MSISLDFDRANTMEKLATRQILSCYNFEHDGKIKLGMGPHSCISYTNGSSRRLNTLILENRSLFKPFLSRGIDRISLFSSRTKSSLPGDVLVSFKDGVPAVTFDDDRAYFNFNPYEAFVFTIQEQNLYKTPSALEILLLQAYWSMPISLRNALRSVVRKRNRMCLHWRDYLGIQGNFIVFLLEKIIDSLGAKRKMDYSQFCAITHDIDSDFCQKEGLRQTIELEKKLGVVSTWFFAPESHGYRLDPHSLQFLSKIGDEIGVHGLKHDGFLDKISFDAIRTRMARAKNSLHDQIQNSSIQFSGFRSPWMLRSPKILLALELEGFRYDSSFPDVDTLSMSGSLPGATLNRPFNPILRIGGIWRKLRLTEIPVTYPQDVQLQEDLDLSREQIIDLWKEKARFVKDVRGALVLQNHPFFLAKDPSIYEELIEYLKSTGFQFCHLHHLSMIHETLLARKG